MGDYKIGIKMSTLFSSDNMKIDLDQKKTLLINDINYSKTFLKTNKKNSEKNINKVLIQEIKKIHFKKLKTLKKKIIEKNIYKHLCSKTKIGTLQSLEGYITFFLLSMYENIIACPGTVFLFGRRNSSSKKTQSCVIKVTNILRNL